jgi:hypothetical protein
VLLDSGNYSDNPTAAGKLKTEALIKGMSMLGYSAANVGEREVRAGYDAFMSRSEGATFPFLSANIVRSDTKEPVFPPHLILDLPAAENGAKHRLGLIGVVRFNPIFRKPGPDGSQLEIIHPREALERELPKLRAEKVDLVILLAALHRDDARRIVAAVPEIDFVIGSYGGVAIMEQQKASDCWILYSGNQGKIIGETRIFHNEGDQPLPPRNVQHYLGDRYPTDPEMIAFINDLSLTPAAGSGAAIRDPGDGPFVGSSLCRSCHVAPFEQWASTPHADSLNSLQEKNKQGEARCLRCHTTGAGGKGGFENLQATPHLAHVGCESCHGAGRAHIENTARRYGAIGPRICAPCHDAKNSPDFDYYSYVTKVTHKEREAE